MDDNRDSANSIIMNLKNDFKIDLFLSAKKVIKAIADGKSYDLLILDYEMIREENGIEVLKRIKMNNIYYIPAIMISAVVYSDQQVQDAMNAGFAKYFAKHDPNLIVKLKSAIIELIAQSHDVAFALEKWVKESPGREEKVISINTKSYTVAYMLNKLRSNHGMDANQRMILVKCVLDFLVNESANSGREHQ